MSLPVTYIPIGPPPHASALTPWDYLLWGLLLLAVILAGGAVLLFRRRLMGRDSAPAAGLTIQQLDRMRTDGILSEEEHRRARRVLAGLAPELPSKPPEMPQGDTGPAPAGGPEPKA